MGETALPYRRLQGGRLAVRLGCLALVLLELAGCESLEETRPERGPPDASAPPPMRGPDYVPDTAIQPGGPLRKDHAHRQYFDQRAKRYYYFDVKTARYYWEDGTPKY
jgi:hypothetical protein